MRQQIRQIALVLKGGDAVQIRFQRGRSTRIDGLFVHASGVEVAFLLLEGAAAGLIRGRRLQQVLEQDAVSVLERVKAAVAGLVRRQRIGRLPATARKLVEVHAGIDRSVQRGDVETGMRLGYSQPANEKNQN